MFTWRCRLLFFIWHKVELGLREADLCYYYSSREICFEDAVLNGDAFRKMGDCFWGDLLCFDLSEER